jgi:hypothetical protein
MEDFRSWRVKWPLRAAAADGLVAILTHGGDYARDVVAQVGGRRGAEEGAVTLPLPAVTRRLASLADAAPRFDVSPDRGACATACRFIQ